MQRFPVPVSNFATDQGNSPQTVEVFSPIGHHAEFVPAIRVDAMRPKQLGHPLHVPFGNMDRWNGKHKTVRELVNDQVPAVVVELLLVGPEFLLAVPAVEKRGQVFGQEPRLLEQRLVGHQVGGHLKFGPPPIGR